jgi:AcrR family transcriptional regulator
VAKLTDGAEVAQDRKALIVEKAAELFASKGIASTTVRAIGDAAGILSGSLYHYFRSKDEIVDEILASFLDDLAARYRSVLGERASAINQLRGLVQTSLSCMAAHPHATEIYQNDANYLAQNPRYEYVRKGAGKVRKSWLSVLEAGVADGTFRDDVPTWLMYHLLRDAIWLTVRWFQPSGAYNEAKLAEDCCKIFLKGFVAPGFDVDQAPPAGLALTRR